MQAEVSVVIRSKDDAKKALDDVYHEFYFHLQDGRVLKNLKDLLHAFRRMAPEVYGHHVNDHKNDFSNWIRDIIKDEKLANQLRALSKVKAAAAVQQRIRFLEGKLAKAKKPKKKTARKKKK